MTSTISVKRIRPIAIGLIWNEDALLEELDVELSEPRLVTVLENLFQYEGQSHHEVVFICEAQVKDARLYHRAEFTIQESSVRMTASWKSLRDLGGNDRQLYPDGLTPVLSELAERRVQPASGSWNSG